MRFLINLIIVLFCFLLISCKTQNLLADSDKFTEKKILDSVFAYDPNYQYKVKTYDKISISIWGQDELSIGSVYGIYNSNEVYGKWLMVDANGNLELPKIGTTYVLGKTILEIKAQMVSEYKKWINNPVIDARVLNKEISMLGELRTPGNYVLDKDHNSLLELISRAGGYDFYANLKHIKVIRQEGLNVRITTVNLTKTENYLNRNILLHPGDIVIVPSKKYKEFDKRISTIIPFTTAVSAAALILRLF